MQQNYFRNLLSMIVIVCAFCSCDTFLQGMGQSYGYGGYGMGGYQVMPGGFVRNTSMDYLLDPRYAMQQVLTQEQQEYQAAKQFRPNLTLEQFRLEKGQAIQMMNGSGNGSSSSTSSSSSSQSTTSSGSSGSSGRSCNFCHGSGKCNTCNGKGYYYNPLDMRKTVSCPNCQRNHNGICAHCGGTGKK